MCDPAKDWTILRLIYATLPCISKKNKKNKVWKKVAVFICFPMEKKVQGDGLGQKGQVKSHKGENKCFLSSRKPQYRKLVEEHFFLSLENFI